MTTLKYIAFYLVVLVSLTCQAVFSTAIQEHHRSKRLSATDALNYGCTAARAVRKCTDLLEDCTNICDNIDAFCQTVSSYNDLLEALCKDDRRVEIKRFFEQELPKLAKGGAETEKALKELGGNVESFGQGILDNLKSAGNVITGKINDLTRLVTNHGCRVMTSAVVMITSLMVTFLMVVLP